MKRGRHDLALADENRIVAFAREDFHLFPNALDLGSADEDGFERAAGQGSFGGVDGDVERAQALLFGPGHLTREQNCAGACAERRFRAHEIAQPALKFRTEKLQECGRFSAGDDESVEVVELFRLAHQDDLGPELLEPAAMRVEVALQCENTNRHGNKTLPRTGADERRSKANRDTRLSASIRGRNFLQPLTSLAFATCRPRSWRRRRGPSSSWARPATLQVIL